METMEEKLNREIQESIIRSELEKIERRRKLWLNGKLYERMTFENDNGKMPSITAKCKFFVENFEKYKENEVGLFLYGETGSGKTFFAVAIANELITRGYKVLVTTLSQIIQGQMDFENAEKKMGDLMCFDCIVVDDIGVNRATPFADEVVQNFVNNCVVNKIILVATSNYSLAIVNSYIKTDKLECLAYARLFSRILGNCEPILVSGVENRNESLKERLKKIRG